MIAAGTVDLAAVRATLRTMLAGDDSRFARLDDAERRARQTPSAPPRLA